MKTTRDPKESAHPWQGNLAANLSHQPVTPAEWNAMVASSGQPYFGLAFVEKSGDGVLRIKYRVTGR